MVYSGDTRPLSIVAVQLQPTVGGPFRTTYTDPSGRFSFSGIAPGNYLIVISVPGYARGTWAIQVGHHSLPLMILTLMPVRPRRPHDEAAAKGSSTVSVRQLRIPDKARKEYRKGFESAARGKTDEAIKHWNKSIKIYPQYAESYMQLSKLYANRGEFDRATEAAKRAVEIDGKSGDPYAFLGYVYLRKKDFPKAKQAFEDATKRSDTDWFSQLWLGKLLLDEKDAEAAYPHLLRASRLKPEVPQTYLFLYNDLVMLGRRKDALAEIDDFLARFPNNPLADKARQKRNALAKALGDKQH